ncbi:DUF4245 domain-containing protein [Streptomyces pathocidini]|uniref:DUF4245 domain-containing protein n=1 Tax=Streptomyces pathocidini TaxID=1650571 RepID=UPI0006E2F656|nr:DUF4245 domain-containing protein [Streptomyces pathocidini]
MQLPVRRAASRASGRATSVTYEGGSADGATWHLGFQNPDDEYVAVEQGNGRASKFVAAVTHGAAKTGGTQRVGDARWERWEGPKYDALVREERGVTTVVTGTAPFGQLAEMAAALKASKSS